MRWVFICLLLTGSLATFGQEPTVAPRAVPPRAIKVSPLHLLSFYPTIELSYEQPIFPRVAVQVEAGYVLDRLRHSRESFQEKRGARAAAK